ncbi:GTP-binding protein [Paenibacillus pasadenensis]|uniref:CobW family GTP-binding protein n=1 Tax=Paenibacillus pasadenensis TaxID=217090 RepID=UPI0020423318|nr:CobW family GTP-binding protein [Paenibacillus pasadenensis]MCM3749013.1 GTP-binding protein [Paenibacillus pasadenensis]
MCVPVYIISGFLGSGKTTLLLRLLEETARRGIAAALLMNEMGKTDVDGAIVSEQLRLPVAKLLDGCICCTKKSEVEASLLGLAAGRPDVLFMELTGVADPGELKQLLQPGSAAADAGLELAGVFTVVDTGTFSAYNSRFSSDRELVRTLRGQLTAADLIVLNKTDRADPSETAKVRRAVRKQNDTAAVLEAMRCDIDVRSLLHGVHPARSKTAAAITERSTTLSDDPSHEHNGPAAEARKSPDASPFQMAKTGSEGFSGGALRSVTLTSMADRPLLQENMERFLLQQGETLLRAKGYLKCGTQTYLVQHAGGRTEWQTSAYPGQPYLVLIGPGLDEDKVKSDWSSLIENGSAASVKQ